MPFESAYGIKLHPGNAVLLAATPLTIVSHIASIVMMYELGVEGLTDWRFMLVMAVMTANVAVVLVACVFRLDLDDRFRRPDPALVAPPANLAGDEQA